MRPTESCDATGLDFAGEPLGHAFGSCGRGRRRDLANRSVATKRGAMPGLQVVVQPPDVGGDIHRGERRQWTDDRPSDLQGSNEAAPARRDFFKILGAFEQIDIDTRAAFDRRGHLAEQVGSAARERGAALLRGSEVCKALRSGDESSRRPARLDQGISPGQQLPCGRPSVGSEPSRPEPRRILASLLQLPSMSLCGRPVEPGGRRGRGASPGCRGTLPNQRRRRPRNLSRHQGARDRRDRRRPSRRRCAGALQSQRQPQVGRASRERRVRSIYG